MIRRDRYIIFLESLTFPKDFKFPLFGLTYRNLKTLHSLSTMLLIFLFQYLKLKKFYLSHNYQFIKKYHLRYHKYFKLLANHFIHQLLLLLLKLIHQILWYLLNFIFLGLKLHNLLLNLLEK